MTLSGFNQEGGKVTGNIQNLTIESKQNTSTTKGSTIGGSLSIAPNGMLSGSVSYSQTKAGGATAVVVGGNRFITGFFKFMNGLYGSGKKKTLNPIRDSIPKRYQGYYDAFEVTVEVGIMNISQYAQPYYSQPNKNVVNISQQQRELNKQMNLNASVGQQKAPISSTKSLAGGKNYNAIKETSQGKVFINDGTPSGTTKARQSILTDSNGNMITLQNNLTTREILLQGINPSGQLIYEKSLTPYQVNALIGTSSSSKILVGDEAVNQVASKLPYNPVLKLPVKYPIKSESGVTIYKDYAIGLRGGKYVEAGITKDNKIAYRNNGSYYVVGQGDDGFKNIPATDVTTNYLISESGGRKGNPETKAQINAIIKIAKDEDWKHVAGGEKSEKYLSALNLGNKSTKDSNYIDITLQKNIKGKEVIVRINTVDIYKNGNLTKREAEAARLINLKIIREGEGNPQLITIPKGQGTGNIEKILKKIEADIEKDTK